MPSSEAADRPKSQVRLLVGCVVAFVFFGFGGTPFATWWLLKTKVWREKKYLATLDEAAYSLSAEEAFRGSPAADPAGEEAAAVAAVEALVAAHGPTTTTDFVNQLHLERMLAQIEANGSLSDLNTRKREREFLTGLRKGMVETLARASAVPSLRWMKVRVARITFRREPPEALAFCHVRTGAQVRMKMRFWLLKEDGRWRVFDWELLEEGQRVSSSVGAVLALAKNSAGANAMARSLNEAPPLLVQAVKLNEEGRCEEALALAGKAAALKPPPMLGAQIMIVEAVALHGLGRSDEALARIDAAVKLHPNLPVARYLAAEVHLAAGRPEECIRELKAYLEALGPDPEAFRTMGAAYQELDRTDDAAMAFEKGIETDPEDWDNRYRLAQIRLAAGDRPAALRLFRESVRLAPNPAEWFAGAMAELQGADAWAEAAEVATDYSRAQPADPDGPYEWGTSLRLAGRHGDARPVLLAGLPVEERSAEPFPVRFWYQLGLCSAALNEGTEAMAYAEKVRATPGCEADGAFLRACVHASGGRTEEAVADLLTALTLAPIWVADAKSEPLLAALRQRPEVEAALQAAEQSLLGEAKKK